MDKDPGSGPVGPAVTNSEKTRLCKDVKKFTSKIWLTQKYRGNVTNVFQSFCAPKIPEEP